jgi:hypothetical protein
MTTTLATKKFKHLCKTVFRRAMFHTKKDLAMWVLQYYKIIHSHSLRVRGQVRSWAGFLMCGSAEPEPKAPQHWSVPNLYLTKLASRSPLSESVNTQYKESRTTKRKTNVIITHLLIILLSKPNHTSSEYSADPSHHFNNSARHSSWKIGKNYLIFHDDEHLYRWSNFWKI